MVDGLLRIILWMVALNYYILGNLWYPGRQDDDYIEFRVVHTLVKELYRIEEDK